MPGGITLNRSRQAPAQDTPAFGGIAERFRRAGDLDRAIALCRDGLQNFPNQLSARATLGWALLDQGNYDQAREELEQVLRRAPDNLAAIRGLAELHERAGDGMDGHEQWRRNRPDDVVAAPPAPPVLVAAVTPRAVIEAPAPPPAVKYEVTPYIPPALDTAPPPTSAVAAFAPPVRTSETVGPSAGASAPAMEPAVDVVDPGRAVIAPPVQADWPLPMSMADVVSARHRPAPPAPVVIEASALQVFDDRAADDAALPPLSPLSLDAIDDGVASSLLLSASEHALAARLGAATESEAVALELEDALDPVIMSAPLETADDMAPAAVDLHAAALELTPGMGETFALEEAARVNAPSVEDPLDLGSVEEEEEEASAIALRDVLAFAGAALASEPGELPPHDALEIAEAESERAETTWAIVENSRAPVEEAGPFFELVAPTEFDAEPSEHAGSAFSDNALVEPGALHQDDDSIELTPTLPGLGEAPETRETPQIEEATDAEPAIADEDEDVVTADAADDEVGTLAAFAALEPAAGAAPETIEAHETHEAHDALGVVELIAAPVVAMVADEMAAWSMPVAEPPALPDKPSPLAALERFLRKVEARRLHLTRESVA